MLASIDWMKAAVVSPKVALSWSTTKPSLALLPNTREANETMITRIGAMLKAPK